MPSASLKCSYTCKFKSKVSPKLINIESAVPLPENGIVCLFIQVSIGVVIYLLNLFILRDEFFNNILNQIIIKLKNMINSNNNNKNKEENKCHKERE